MPTEILSQQADAGAVEQAVRRAIACHQAGRLNDAERLYRGILQVDQNHADVNFNLGVLSVQMKQPAAGLPHFITALNADPTRRQYWLGYIDALLQSDKPEDAREVLELARQYGLDGDEIDVLAGRARAQIEEQSNVKTLHADRKTPVQQGSQKKAKQKFDRNKHPAPEEINALILLFNEGRLAEVVDIARKMTMRYPLYGFGWKALGTSLRQTGKRPDALAAMQKAVRLMPGDAETHSNLGLVLNDMNRLDEAEASYLRALQIKPDYAEAHSNLGTLLHDKKHYSDAEIHLRKAISLNPHLAEAHYNLANTLKEMERLVEAEASYRQAIQIRPDYAEAHNNMGVVLMLVNRLDEAEASCRQAIKINPAFAWAHNNLGIILNDLKRPNEAISSYMKALEINPDSAAEIYNNLAGAMRKPDDAMECLRMAIKIKPDYAQAYNTMGNAELMRGRLDDSVACFRNALKYKPDFAMAHSNLIYTLDLMTSEDVVSLQAARKRWDDAHGAPFYKQRPHGNNPDPQRRLRVGYVSADIKDHSATKVFGGMLTRFDRAQFEVFAYSNFKGQDDRSTEFFKQHVTVWRSVVGLSDDAAAKMIREDEIDILVDLSGHSAGNRLLVFARKPAPIQITAWGYASGTGMRAMDVFFSDPVMVPPDEKHYFSEEVRYLPCVIGAFYNDPFPDVDELPALSEGVITFGTLNRLTKLSPEACLVWAKVLLAIPNSRLLLKSPESQDAATRERIVGHFTKAGVSAKRIVMQGGSSWHEHMRAYNQIDIALDPFPHGGGVTSLESLMMGVPVLTQLWPTMPGRVSASIMTVLGLSDWIAGTSEEYVDLAVRKAQDLKSLSELRRQLRSIFTSSIVGDQDAYVRAVEQEYRTLWREWCSSQSSKDSHAH